MDMGNQKKGHYITRSVDFMRWCVALMIAAISLACSFSAAGSNASQAQMNTRVENVKPQPSPAHSTDSPIRAVDFANFLYPAKPIYTDGEKGFALKDGKYKGRPGLVGAAEPFGSPYPVSLAGIVYGDLTNDGRDEAMVVLAEGVAGTAIPYYVYVFGMNGNHPHLLWASATGDRGDGGLRKIYAEKGDLVIELYGKNTTVDEIEDKEEETAACCPKSFTRTRYEWDGTRFRQKGESEVLLNPLSNAELLLMLIPL
jgi:hypothetical protein